MREEKDILGKINIPDEAVYGIYTLRALDNFPITGERINLYILKALLNVKKAAVFANHKTGRLAADKYEVIKKALDLLLDETEKAIGKESFTIFDKIIVDPYHGGAGAPLNMNISEVIANIALQILGRKPGQYDIIHPVNHVNMSQTINDTYLTSFRIASLSLIKEFKEALLILQKSLLEKAEQFGSVVKLGRTQMQDAAAITLGREFGSYAKSIERTILHLQSAEDDLTISNICGNSAGDDKEYINSVNDEIKNLTGFAFTEAEDNTDATQNLDVFVSVHGVIKTGACTIIKICNDLMLLSSGPNGGVGEIILPVVQSETGEGLIPGKINPVILENAIQVSEMVKGHDLIISNLVSSGSLESNAYQSMIAHLLLKSIEMMRDSVINLSVKCIQGIEADEERCRKNLIGSPAVADSLVNIFGYERIAKIINESEEKGISFIELLKQKKILSEKELIGLISREMGIKSEKR